MYEARLEGISSSLSEKTNELVLILLNELLEL